MSALRPRDTQTKVKHEILKNYLAKWGYIICEGVRGQFVKLSGQGKPFKIKFVYVDGFAYSGRYADEEGKSVFGSPIIGIEALIRLKDYAINNIGFSPEIVSIVFEKEHREYDALFDTLTNKYGSAIKNTTDFSSLRNGEINVVHGNYQDYLNQLLAFSGQNYTWAFYLLDPYGSSGIPLETVSPIVSQEHNDVMINFPYLDLQRKSGPAARNDPEQEKHNQYNDKMFGGSEWRGIAEKYYSDLSEVRKDEMEGKLVDKYKETLQLQDMLLSIKTIRLKFPDMERTMFYLFLTTHDPTGALALNEILDEAKFREFELREARKSEKKGGQLSLFSLENDPARPPVVEADIDDVANLIYDNCKGQIIEYRHVLRYLIDEPFHPDAIKQAMTKLKKSKKAEYESPLRNKTVVTFR